MKPTAQVTLRDDIITVCALLRGRRVALETTLVAIALLTLAWLRGLAGLDVWALFRTSAYLPRNVRLTETSPASLCVVALWATSAIVFGIWLWRRRFDSFRPVRLVVWALTLGAIALEILGANISIHYSRNGPWYWSLFTAAPQLLWPILWSWVGREIRDRRVPISWAAVGREIPFIASAAAVALIVVLGLWSGLPTAFAHHLFADVKKPSSEATELLHRIELTFAAVWVGITRILWSRMRRWKPLNLSGATIAAIATLCYLAWDEPASAPLPSLAQLALLPPYTPESSALVRRVPAADSETRALPQYGWIADPRDFRQWRLIVVAHREAIRANGAAASAEREWLEQMDAFEAIGDDSPYGQESGIPSRTIGRLTMLQCAYATLLAMEHREEEALTLLQRMFSVGRKLQISAHTVLPFFVGRAMQDFARQTAAGVIEYGSVNLETLQNFATVLRRETGPGTSAALLWQAELQVRALPRLKEEMPGILLSRHLGPWQRLFYLPHATENLVIAQYSHAAEIVGEGRGEEYRLFERDFYQTSFKNAFGALLAALTAPPFNMGLQNSWRAEDDRRALLAKVEAKIAAIETRSVPPAKGPR